MLLIFNAMKSHFKITFVLNSFLILILFGFNACNQLPSDDVPASSAVELKNQKYIYRGIDNPIKVVCEQKYSGVSVSNGSIVAAAQPGEYILKPDSVGICTLTLKENEKIVTTNSIQVKSIPEPDLFLGEYSSPARVNTEDLSKLTSLSARAENIDTSILAYKVISWEIIAVISAKPFECSGKGETLSKEALEIVNSLHAGARFYLDAQVVGPDGNKHPIRTFSMTVNPKE